MTTLLTVVRCALAIILMRGSAYDCAAKRRADEIRWLGMLRGAWNAVTWSGLSRPSRIARYSSRETDGRLAACVRRLAINNAAFDNAPCGASSAAGFRRGFSHGGDRKSTRLNSSH